MEITTIWSILKTDYEEQSGRINRIHYKVESSDGEGTSHETYGSVSLIGPVELAIELVTEELALQWVYDHLGDEVAIINGIHIDAISRKKNDKGEVTGLPWEE